MSSLSKIIRIIKNNRKQYWKSIAHSRENIFARGPCFLCCRLISNLPPPRRKIRLIESNAKCRYLKKLTCKGTLRQLFYLSEAPSPPMTPYSFPLTHCIRVYSYLFSIHTGWGERGEVNQREC